MLAFPFLLSFSLPFFLSLIHFVSLPLGAASILADLKVSFGFLSFSLPSPFLLPFLLYFFLPFFLSLICFISLPLGAAFISADFKVSFDFFSFFFSFLLPADLFHLSPFS